MAEPGTAKRLLTGAALLWMEAAQKPRLRNCLVPLCVQDIILCLPMKERP
uniref:Uncharacterized protein n=1 Tax=Picea sitchensis TaxID=3332 RepID=A0A6B9XTR6_PICSI|nr:hypothetical protein Q903MT_gene5497 [Picea sitchensis]